MKIKIEWKKVELLKIYFNNEKKTKQRTSDIQADLTVVKVSEVGIENIKK